MNKKITVDCLKVKLFADGADKAGMLEMYANPHIKGFTTNPTLMRKAGVKDYLAFASEMVSLLPDRPLSLEVFSDEFEEMEVQALQLAELGENIYVKIPITNSRGESALDLVRLLVDSGVKVNVTAVMTVEQVEESLKVLKNGPASYLSIFAGRIADSGLDPLPMMKYAVELLENVPNVELIWASPRELLNVVQANDIGCHIITATNDILNKLHLLGKDLAEFSLDTVKMFRNDAVAAGFSIPLVRDLRIAGNY